MTKPHLEEKTKQPIVIDAYDALLYDCKGAINMHWSYLSRKRAYYVVIQPWKDSRVPSDYLRMFENGQILPKNVAVYISDDPAVLSENISSFKFIKPKYARIRKKNKKTQERIAQDNS